MGNFIGTAYFCSKKAAYAYFKKEGNDKEAVDEYLKEKLIYIGFPPNVDKSELSTIEGRYFRTEK
jgi:hypothetical protein